MGSPSAGLEALHRLNSIEPPLWLSPSTELSQAARVASQYVFSSLQPFCPKSPFDHLLVDGFDAEQIWQQIDLQSQPLLSNLRREIKRFETNPDEISKFINGEIVKKEAEGKPDGVEKENVAHVEESGGQKENDEDFDDMEDDEIGISDEDDGEDGEEEDEGEEEEEEQEVRNEANGGIEDRFLKIKELEEYLENDEAREYGGLSNEKQRKEHNAADDDDNDDEEGDDDDEEDEDEDVDEVSSLNSVRVPKLCVLAC